MFTGIIQRVGTLTALQRRGGAGCLTMQAGAWDPPLTLGESVAVEGVCLTVAEIAGAEIRYDVLEETLEKTTLGQKASGAEVNIERAVRAGDFLGGHIVSGHVDGVGALRAIGRAGADRVLEIACGRGLLGGLVAKGSVAINGISLTVVELRPDAFTVHIIPHTWDHTTFRAARVGDAVNLETDVIGKYVARFMEARSGGSSLTLDKLRAAGYMD